MGFKIMKKLDHSGIQLSWHFCLVLFFLLLGLLALGILALGSWHFGTRHLGILALGFGTWRGIEHYLRT
jgi:hypothetical protein